MRQFRYHRFCLAFSCLIGFASRFAAADAYDPPATYYNTATGTGATLKQQLHSIITTGDMYGSYDDARTSLQITDADLSNPNLLRVVYNNGVAIAKPTGGSIPGWDSGTTWNREHSWPQSRGVDTTSSPDGADLHHLFSSKRSDNTARGNLNYGGVFGIGANGTGGRGTVSDGGTKYYPGDADAGLIARAEFYMAVRYDGTESGTADLELANGDPADNGTLLGDLSRLLEWHYSKAPDTFERKRNQIIYTSYQVNRNPFIDHPEYVWSIFVGQTNNSQLAISGATVNADGSSTRNVDLGRVFVGATVPTAQAFTINKSGANGTYFQVTTSGAATSSLSGRFNNMRTNQTDSKAITIGLNTTTTSAGLKSGSVTIDNLDITTGGGAGKGGNDANDTFNVNLAVLDHAMPSFASSSAVTTLSHDFGTIAVGSTSSTFNFDVYNLLATAGYTASMDFDSIAPVGDTAAFTTNLAASSGSLVLAGGASQTFTAALTAATVGTFSATYVLNFSDENIAGALNKSLTLMLSGTTQLAALAGDYNGDFTVDAADYSVWRSTMGQSVTPFSSADGDGNGMIDNADYDVWRSNFGATSLGNAAALAKSAVPEPATLALIGLAAMVTLAQRPARRQGR